MNTQITDETLHAFIDQQLTPSEMGEVFEAIKQGPELVKRSCEICQLKSLVKHAYDGVEPSRSAHWSSGRSWGMQAAAAVLLLGWAAWGGREARSGPTCRAREPGYGRVMRRRVRGSA